MESRTKSTFKFVFITLFVDLLAFTLILPLLPKILDYYATNDKSKVYKLFNENVEILQNLMGVPESHNKVLLAGILGSWFSLLQFISSPLLGALSDKFGRKMILLLAMSGTVLSYAIWFAASESFGLFVLSRTVGGLCKANVGLSLAIVSDVADEKNRGKGMALVGSSFSLAFIIGPLFGAYLSTMAGSSDEQLLPNQLIINPSLIALLLSLINIALVSLFIKETSTLKKKYGHDVDTTRKSRENTFSRAFQYVNPQSLFSFSLVEQKTKDEAKILKRTGLIYFTYLLFYSGLEFTLSFLTHIRFGFSSMDQGKLYLFSGLIMALIQGGYIRRIKGGKELKLALIGLALIVPSFIIMGLSSSVGQIYMALILYAFSSAVVVPCLTTITSSQSPFHSRGAVMGTFRSLGSLARAIGPCVASLLFWTFGSTFCYIGGAIALLLPLYLMRGLFLAFNQRKESHNATIKTKKTVAFDISPAKAS